MLTENNKNPRISTAPISSNSEKSSSSFNCGNQVNLLIYAGALICRPAKNFRKVQCCIAEAHTPVVSENAKSVANENAKLFIVFLEQTASVPDQLL